MAEQWLSIVEYSREFSISDMTVRRRIKTGKLKALLKDGKYYIPVNQGQDNAKLAGGRDDKLVHFPAGQNPEPHREPIKARPASLNSENHLQVFNPAPKPLTPRTESFKPAGGGYDEPVGQSLLAFCEQTLDRHETLTQRKYEAIIKSYESRLAQLEAEIQQYKQQIDDLQLLVKIFESSETPLKLSR